MSIKKRPLYLILSAIVSVGVICTLAISGGTYSLLHFFGSREDASQSDWNYYRGNPNGTMYSTLKDINTSNADRLTLAWTFDTGEGEKGGSELQMNPLIIDGRMYALTPKGRVIALDGSTGQKIWEFNPAGDKPVRTRQRSRGVSFWQSGNEKRVFTTFRSELIALNADTGKVISEFGQDGRVALNEGIDRDPKTISVANVTPGAVYDDLIILGSTGRTPGDIRAFDVRTGKLRWVFHTIPHPGEYGYESWPKDAWKTAQGANNWAGMSVDPTTGMVFIPLASGGMADKDFYGADRPGNNLYANSILALDAKTGKRVWHFQTIKHDLWDRDLPAPPTLITVKRNGKPVKALAQITKSGHVFILNRLTGESLYPLKEFAVPPSDIPGEMAAKTQVLPTLPEPFARQQITEETLSQRTPEIHAAVKKHFAELRSEPWAPPSLEGTLMMPGTDGGGEWGGASFDPETGLLYINSIEMAKILKLKPRPQLASTGAKSTGEQLYKNTCAACHGEDRKGNPPDVPSLIGVGDRLPFEEIMVIVGGGSGRMPSFWTQLGMGNSSEIVRYLTGATASNGEPGEVSVKATVKADDSPFIFDGYTKFLDQDKYPAITPPWGTLNALDVNTGRYVWKIPFGEYPELVKQGIRNTGSENYGGGIVTAGGLLIIGATAHDSKFHVFDKASGKLLWETTLPLAGIANPSTYKAGGKQFIVIAAGGSKSAAIGNAKIVAFTLK
jgi:quinoprotein glucose dehydrogenase